MTERQRPALFEVIGGKNDELGFILDYCSFPEIFRLSVAFSNVDPRDEAAARPILAKVSSLKTQLVEDLKNASLGNDIPAVQKLLKRGVHPSIAVGSMWEGMMTPLCAASFRGNHQVVKLLLEAGTNVNWRDEEGTSALDFAITRRRYPNLQGRSSMPLDAGSDVDETIRLLRAAGGLQFSTVERHGYHFGDY